MAKRFTNGISSGRIALEPADFQPPFDRASNEERAQDLPMVATLAKAATADYYVHSQASFRPADDYYLSGEEPDGIWWNPSGLLSDGETRIEHGEVLDSAHFYRLYRGLDPFTGEKLTRTADTEKRCPAYDLVFNADKTVSALWAIAPADLRAELEKAHNDAVQTALKETIQDHCSYTRIREDERGHKVVPADIMAALFQHGASRSNDPHLHTHCVIFNLARAHHDGRWRALHGKPLYSWQKAAGATYRAELAQLLGERLGIEMETHGDDGEYTRIAGTPAELVEEWSKRDIEITDTASRFGVNLRGNSALHSAIQKMTRAAKQHGVHPDTRHVNWSLDASRHVEDIPAFVESLVGRELEFTDEQKLALARRMAAIPGELTRYQSVFKYPDVVEKVANASAGLLTGERRNAMVEEVLATQSVIELDKPDTSYDAGARLQHGRTFTAAHTIQTERDIHRLTSSLIATEHYGIEEETTKAKIDKLIADDYPIDPEQADAIRAATAPGQIAVIEGAAGSGKTTTLRPIADLYRETGHDIIATAVSWRVTLELGSDLETDNWCVDKLTVGIANGTIRVGPRTVIVVDEAGQLSSLQALKVLRIAESTGAKIIFAGDTQQQQPVEAGPGLRLILDVAGSTRVDTIRRQKHDVEDMLVALHDVPRASAREAAAAATPEELAAIPGDFDKLPDNRRSDVKPWQVRASEDFRDGKAAAAIAAYHRRGRIHMDSSLDRTLGRIVDDWHRVRTEQPDKTTAVIAHSKVEVRALSHLMRERVLKNYGGPRHVVQACRGRGPKAKPEPLEIAIGDTIRTGAANFRKRLFNGTHLQVLDLREDPPSAANPGVPRLWIQGRTDRGRIVEFFHDEIRDWHGKIRLDHGYAMTMNAAQGLTVDRAFVFANQKPSRETIYPAATRHRERMDMYIDRAPIELDVRHRRSEDLATEPVTNAEILGYLAANWSRANPEEAAQDYMSEHMRARYIHGGSSAPAAGAGSAEAQAPSPSHRPAASPTSPGRERLPDPERVSTPAWLAANDAGDGRLSEAAAKIRYDEAALKHGVAARTIGQACQRVSASLATWDERRKTEGNAAVASDPRFRTDLREATALLKTAAPFLKHDPLHARILHQHAGIDAGDLKKLVHGQRRAISIRDMSVPERRKANPLFTHTAPVKTPEQAAADSIEAVLATLEPSPGPSQTRQTPAPAPTREPAQRQTTAEKFAAKHEAANLAEDRRREREHPWPENFTAPDRIELQDPQGRILVATRADAPEHRDLEPAHTPAVPAGSDARPSPAEHHARAATPDEQRTADAYLAEANPAYSAAPAPSSGADHARHVLSHEAAAAERFLNPGTPDRDHSSPTPEITPTRALEAIVDAALPDDIALSEEAARHNGDQRQPIKETLMSRFIGAVHSVIEGRGGTADQLSAAAAKSTELDRQNIYGELDNTQRAEHEDRSHYVADSDTALRNMHAQFTAFFEERTGKSWTPPTPDDHSGNTRYTAASAEAIKLVERIQQERAKARLPQGYPIAVTALKDATVDRQTIFERLDKVLEKRPDMFIAHGNAKGTIQDVSDWAKERGVEQVRVPIDYNLPKSQQVVKRDQRILDTVKPRGVIEITNGTEKTTALVEKARALSTGAPRDKQIPIMRINPAPSRQQERAEDTSHRRSATERQSQGRARSAGMSM